MSDSQVVRVKTDTWRTLGVDLLPGFYPEAIQAASTQQGSDTLGFLLRARPDDLRAELPAFTPVEYLVDGKLVWDGYTWDNPKQAGGDPQVQVNCRGWQYYADDDPYAALYVHNRVGDWRDQRTFLTANLVTFFADPRVTNEDPGVAILAFPNTIVIPASGAVAITLDLGLGNTAAAISVDTEHTGNDGSITFLARTTDTESITAAGTSSDAFSYTLTGGVNSRTDSGNFSSPQRYVHLWMQRSTAATEGADVYVRIKAIRVFGKTGYRSAAASVLKATDIIKDARNKLTLLDQSDEFIAATTLSLPAAYSLTDPRTPREWFDVANSYHRYRLKVRLDKKLSFQPYPATPVLEIGSWPGSEWTDGAGSSGENLYNKAVVTADGPDGANLQITRLASALTGAVTTPLDRQGRLRTKILQVGVPSDTATMQVLGDEFLRLAAFTPFKGSVTVTGRGAARLVTTGEPVDPEMLLDYAGELIRITNIVDPVTGALGRDGIITGVSYADGVATLQIDNDRSLFEVLLARLAVVQDPAYS